MPLTFVVPDLVMHRAVEDFVVYTMPFPSEYVSVYRDILDRGDELMRHAATSGDGDGNLTAVVGDVARNTGLSIVVVSCIIENMARDEGLFITENFYGKRVFSFSRDLYRMFPPTPVELAGLRPYMTDVATMASASDMAYAGGMSLIRLDQITRWYFTTRFFKRYGLSDGLPPLDGVDFEEFNNKRMHIDMLTMGEPNAQDAVADPAPIPGDAERRRKLVDKYPYERGMVLPAPVMTRLQLMMYEVLSTVVPERYTPTGVVVEDETDYNAIIDVLSCIPTKAQVAGFYNFMARGKLPIVSRVLDVKRALAEKVGISGRGFYYLNQALIDSHVVHIGREGMFTCLDDGLYKMPPPTDDEMRVTDAYASDPNYDPDMDVMSRYTGIPRERLEDLHAYRCVMDFLREFAGYNGKYLPEVNK